MIIEEVYSHLLGEMSLYKIHFYADKKGNEPVREYIEKLKEKAATDKKARVKLKKIVEFFGIYSTCYQIFIIMHPYLNFIPALDDKLSIADIHFHVYLALFNFAMLCTYINP